MYTHSDSYAQSFLVDILLTSIGSLTPVQYPVGPSPLFFVTVEAALLNTAPRGKGHFGGLKPSAFVSWTICVRRDSLAERGETG